MRHLLSRLLLITVYLCTAAGYAQTYTANPSVGANNTSVGTLSWTSPGNILTADGTAASITAKGTTNYLDASGFGFSIPSTTSITGIQLDVKKSTLSPTVVTVLNNWTAGLTKTISSGGSRCLLMVLTTENGLGARQATSITYGGKTMTQYTTAIVGSSGGFQGNLEVWYLLESNIASASNTSFVITYNSVSLSENAEYPVSAVFTGVDQNSPFSAVSTMTSSSTAATLALSPSFTTTTGGLAVAAIHCGNNTSPNSSVGGTGTYTVSSGYTEVIDTYTANASASTSGMCLNVSNKTISTAGTEAPTFTFAGTPNRQAVICLNMQCLRELDNSVRLKKAGVITGSDLALTTTPWSTTSAYISYGSSTNMWGTSWLASDLNASNFGAVLSAIVSNGTALVDHMQITVTGNQALPIELMDFYGDAVDGRNCLKWQTASEHCNKLFVVERSNGVSDFIAIGSLAGKGNSTVFNSYAFTDDAPFSGISYYRLKQVDEHDSFRYSPVIAIVNTSDHTAGTTVFPNPSCDGRFVVAMEQVANGGVFIYSEDMKLIKTFENSSRQLEISLTELTDGVYYLVFNTNGKQTIRQVQKFCR